MCNLLSKGGAPWFHICDEYQIGPEGGGVGLLLPKLYVDVPAEPRKFDFLCTNFLSSYPPISIPFFDRKAPNFAQIGYFLQ